MDGYTAEVLDGKAKSPYLNGTSRPFVHFSNVERRSPCAEVALTAPLPFHRIVASLGTPTMYRLFLILLLLLVLIFLLRNVYRGGKRKEGGYPVQGDQMVQDPVCKVFVPRGAAIVRQVGFVEYCFCSQTCADEFQKQQRG